MEKLGRISQYTLTMFNDAIEKHVIVHDSDLKRWSLEAKKVIDSSFNQFIASDKWL